MIFDGLVSFAGMTLIVAGLLYRSRGGRRRTAPHGAVVGFHGFGSRRANPTSWTGPGSVAAWSPPRSGIARP